MASTWGGDQTRFFFELTPERVLDAVEAAGFLCTGRCAVLNSFENRVYDVELETDEKPRFPSANHRVVKFYRPGRWSREQILEEHRFLLDLQESEIPAIAPLQFPDGETLKQETASGIWYAVFPKVGGRAPDELSDEQLTRVGRLLARVHNVGAAGQAKHRMEISCDTYGVANLKFLLEGDWIPLDLKSRYQASAEEIIETVRPWFSDVSAHRLHGDCHLGNLLWNQDGPFFLDFDDMVRGPAIQDVWLLLPGRPGHDPRARADLETLLAGYEEMRSFDWKSLRLIEPLRSLRFIHYAAWLARRWEDPAFPRAFPQFGSHRYWSEQVHDLEEQLRLIRMIAQGSFPDPSQDPYSQ